MGSYMKPHRLDKPILPTEAQRNFSRLIGGAQDHLRTKPRCPEGWLTEVDLLLSDKTECPPTTHPSFPSALTVRSTVTEVPGINRFRTPLKSAHHVSYCH